MKYIKYVQSDLLAVTGVIRTVESSTNRYKFSIKSGSWGLQKKYLQLGHLLLTNLLIM